MAKSVRHLLQPHWLEMRGNAYIGRVKMISWLPVQVLTQSSHACAFASFMVSINGTSLILSSENRIDFFVILTSSYILRKNRIKIKNELFCNSNISEPTVIDPSDFRKQTGELISMTKIC